MMERPLNDKTYWALVRHNKETESRCRELEATLENIRGEIIPSYMKLLEAAEGRATEAQVERDIALAKCALLENEIQELKTMLQNVKEVTK